MDVISETQQNVLTLVSATLFHAPVNISATADWKAIFTEAKLQSVVPIVFSSAEPYIPDEEIPVWRQYVNRALASNMHVEWEHTQLHELMTAGNVPYVVLKGSASAAYYHEPMLRTMGDVDFLVKKSDLDRTVQIIESVGIIPKSENENNHHISCCRREGSSVSTWEVHWEVGGLPDGVIGEILRKKLSDICDKAILHQTPNGQYLVPAVFHHGLILLLHTASHIINTGVGVRHLCDWAVFVNSLSDSEFTGIFEETLRSAGLWRFTQLLTAVAVKYLHCRERPWATVKDEALLENIMSDIFAGGNFGRKDSERINEAKLMTDHSKATVDDTGFLRQFCNTMNQIAQHALPATKRHPILLPFGWIYVVGRRILRILTGKRPAIHPVKMIKGATERKKLYVEFRLFQTEKNIQT